MPPLNGAPDRRAGWPDLSNRPLASRSQPVPSVLAASAQVSGGPFSRARRKIQIANRPKFVPASSVGHSADQNRWTALGGLGGPAPTAIRQTVPARIRPIEPSTAGRYPNGARHNNRIVVGQKKTARNS